MNDKGTKGKRARTVPLITEIRPIVTGRLAVIADDPMARLFTGPRGGRITTAVLRDATHWDEVVTQPGHSHLRRHDLRHTGPDLDSRCGRPGSRAATHRLACEDRSRSLALLPGVVADLSHSSVFCSTGEGFAGRSGS